MMAAPGRHTLVIVEAVFWLLAVACVFAFPGYLSLATSIAIMALFAVSLDLVLGFAGIVTLGHAMYFGMGAYAAAWIAQAGWQEPVSGLVLAALAAAALAGVTGPFVLRFTGLPLIMVTLVLGLVCYEAANKATALTGGDNGMTGITFGPVFGVFRWSVYNTVEYLYALSCLFIGLRAARRIVGSPFGLALRGIRENARRMALVGAPVQGHLLRAYVISAFIAGIAGALATQTTKFVGLNVLSLTTSVDVLVMLVVGGVGVLYGAIIGAVVYMVVHHLAAEWNPYHWMFIIGFLLIAVVRLGRGGLFAFAAALAARWSRSAGAAPR